MSDGRLNAFLNRFADVRAAETRAATYLFTFFFLTTFSFYIIKPVKENFLIGVTPAWWPYADLATALLIGFVVAFNARLIDHLPRRAYMTGTILFFVSALFVFWYVFDTGQQLLARTPMIHSSAVYGVIPFQVIIRDIWPLPVFVFCFFSDVFIAMSVTQFWIAVNDTFDPYQAKRLIGLFVSGGLLGGIAGALLTSLLVRVVGPENLLLFCPGILLLVLATVHLLHGEQRKLRGGSEPPSPGPKARVGYLESFAAVRKNKYLLLLAGLLASAMVAGSLINFQFKIVVKDVYEYDVGRTSFLGNFYLGVLFLSTVFHWAATRRVLKNFGIRLALLVAPVFLLLGSLSIFLLPAGLFLVWAIFVRGSDKIFDNTVSQSVRELLYIPVPEDIKYRAKIFIDMFVNKFAVGLGAGLFLLLFHVSRFAYKPASTQVREIGFLVLGFIALWIVLIVVVYGLYPSVLKKDLNRKWIDANKAVKDNVDMDVTGRVFDALESRDRSTTLYIMNIFDLIRKGSLSPELKELLGFKQDELRARSLDCLLDVGGEVFFRGFEEAIADKDFEVEVRKVFASDDYKAVMEKRLEGIAGSESDIDRMEAAKLVGMMEPTPEVMRTLGLLLRDPSSQVVTYALGGVAVHRPREHVPLVLRHLESPLTLQDAQTALAAYGPAVEDVLKEALQDRNGPPGARRAIPEVLSRFGTQRSADILLAELACRQEDLEADIVEALYKIRAVRPDVRFKAGKVRQEILFLIERSYEIFLEEVLPGMGRPGADTRAEALLDLKIKRVFDLLTLIHPAEDIVKAYQNILQGTRKSVDYSLELLDNLLDRDLKSALFPLIEDLPPAERAARLRKAIPGLGQTSVRSRLK
ncbi:MAG: MFS transporter [Candidatus Aminicenantes bacterium]|nr:MFS transporter [Candidatus Aminicenantes bacterium]